ncbi:MAG: regulatory iron-sulfur-containing complex subunit RicT [Gemmatimonadaceae bacterium]|nr:regulatory iron-sulfur-containing complex subunit RicT [Gemmatimonadaceae bacterium]
MANPPLVEEPSGPPESTAPPADAVVEVAFKGNRREFFLWSGPTPSVGTPVVVDADRGEDYGTVHSIGERALTRGRGAAHGFGPDGWPTARIIRLATKGDRQRHAEMRERDEPSRREAMERVRHYRLAMKLADAEWRFDRQRLVLYFTSEQRVDFRELVRDLASRFRTRIELRQIGVRDEAKRLSGIGRCGREYCSASWLPELKPVNLGVAKDQKLSLNPTQISGACGRLMCCLRYEHEFYVQQRKKFPKEGKIIATPKGEEKVLAIDIFRERMTLRSAEGETRVVTLVDFQRELAGELPLPSVGDDEPSESDASSDDLVPEEPPRPTRSDRRGPQAPGGRAPSGAPDGRGGRSRALPVAESRPPREDTRPGRGPKPGGGSPPPRTRDDASARGPAPSAPSTPAAPSAASGRGPAAGTPDASAAGGDERRRRRGRRGGRRHKPGGGPSNGEQA